MTRILYFAANRKRAMEWAQEYNGKAFIGSMNQPSLGTMIDRFRTGEYERFAVVAEAAGTGWSINDPHGDIQVIIDPEISADSALRLQCLARIRKPNLGLAKN